MNKTTERQQIDLARQQAAEQAAALGWRRRIEEALAECDRRELQHRNLEKEANACGDWLTADRRHYTANGVDLATSAIRLALDDKP